MNDNTIMGLIAGGGTIPIAILLYWAKGVMKDLQKIPEILIKIDKLLDVLNKFITKNAVLEERIENLEKRIERLEDK